MDFIRSIAGCLSALVLVSASTFGSIIDVTTGTAGSFTGVPQSFNETRGVAVTVQGAANQQVASMTLSGLFISVPTATVGARIYDDTTTTLIASGQVSVSTGSNLQVTVPIAALLLAGGQYRLCFYVSAGGFGGSGTMFDPAPSGIGGFPYVESTGTLAIQQAYAVSADAFPVNQNFFVPRLSLDVCASAPALIDLTSGTGGTLFPGQSFNETRGVDFVVQPRCSALSVQSMTLTGLNISTTTGTVGARIYDSVTTALLASAQTTVGTGSGLTVTIPLSTTLAIGGQYRACFFVDAGGFGGSGTLFDPTPAGVGGFPYTDSTGALSILGGFQLGVDAFPTTPSSTSICRISINLNPGSPSGFPYCFGDGSGTACPCANGGTAGNGCANGINPSGANLTVVGNASIAADTWQLQASGVTNGPGLYFQGTTKLGGGNGVAFGDGLRCVGGSIVRLGVVVGVANTSTYPSPNPPAVNAIPISLKGLNSAGNVRNYQLWYRDSTPAFCTASVFNLTNGITGTWIP